MTTRRRAKRLSDAAVSYAFEQLEPSDPPARDAMARMIARARAEAEQIHESARTEGFAAGHRDGRERGAAEIGSAASALGQAAHGIDALREGTAKAIEADAVELALALAAKILAGDR